LENKEIRNLGLLFGAVAGVLTVVYFLFLYFTDVMLFDDAYKADFWVTIPMIVMAIVYLRKVQNSLRVWQGLIMGLYIIIACSSISALFYYGFLNFIDVDFMSDSWDHRLALIQQSIDKATDEKALTYFKDVYEKTVEFRKTSSTYDVAMDKIFWHYFVGLIVTFITSVIARK